MYISKNDIKTLPFDKLYQDIRSLQVKLESIALENMRTFMAGANNRRIKDATAMAAKYFDSEAGSDGIEEAAIETTELYDLDDAKLSHAEVKTAQTTAEQECISRFIGCHSLGSKHSWFLPQLIAYFGRWTPIMGDDGLYDPYATLAANATDDYAKGLWYLATKSSRSDLLKDPVTSVKMYQLGTYNHLVPLILNGIKLHHNISYSRWSKAKINWLVDAPLAAAMCAEVPNFSPEQLLEIRNDCLVWQSGARQGKVRDPKTSHALFGVDKYAKYPVFEIPKLAQIMLTQIWCAHPANRTRHMVLDPRDWDAMPPPLVDINILAASTNDEEIVRI